MTLLDFIEFLGAGLVGILIQVLVKIRAIKARAKAGNVEMNVSDFLKTDWPILIMNFLCVCLVIMAYPKILNSYSDMVMKIILPWIIPFFAFVGYTGSSVFLSLFSKSEKYLQNVIDVKTNVLDKAVNTGAVDHDDLEQVKQAQDQFLKK